MKMIINCETGEVTERELNEEELKQFEIDKKETLARKKEEEKKIVTREAILERLGLTEEEARLLLG